MNSTWLLVIAGIAGAVILSGRSAALVNWIATVTKGPAGELDMIAKLVEAAKTIQDAEQRSKVREACAACFTGWLKSKLPEG